jgi:hypothetical protein
MTSRVVVHQRYMCVPATLQRVSFEEVDGKNLWSEIKQRILKKIIDMEELQAVHTSKNSVA